MFVYTQERPGTGRYNIWDLINEGFPRTTIYYYIQRGVLPRPHGGRGPCAWYDNEHIRILREIRRVRDENRTLNDIKEAAALERASRSVR